MSLFLFLLIPWIMNYEYGILCMEYMLQCST